MRSPSSLVALAAALAAGVAAQQSSLTSAPTLASTSSAPAPASTDLPGLLAQLPKCALSCLQTAATAVKCQVTDLKCLCSNSTGLISSLGPCVAFSSTCNGNDINTASSLAQQICADANTANPSALASASNAVTSAIGTATQTSAQGNGAPVQTAIALDALKMAGAAGVFAVFAL